MHPKRGSCVDLYYLRETQETSLGIARFFCFYAGADEVGSYHPPF